MTVEHLNNQGFNKTLKNKWAYWNDYLLEKEGLTIQNDTVQNFDDHFWDPATDLS